MRIHPPIIFLLDENIDIHLINFWNWRCIYPNIIPFPYKKYSNPEMDLNKKLIKSGCTKLIYPESFSTFQLEKLCVETFPLAESTLLDGDTFAIFNEKDYCSSPSVFFDKQYISIEMDSHRNILSSELTSLFPPFLSNESFSPNEFCFTNTLNLKRNEYFRSNLNIAFFYPIDCKLPVLDLSCHPVVSTKEGLNFFPSRKNTKLDLLEGHTVIQNYFSNKGIKTKFSKGTESAKQILKMLPPGVLLDSIRIQGILELLNSMARNEIKSLPVNDLLKKVHEIIRNNESEAANNIIKNLCNRKVWERGMQTLCPHCNTKNWHSISEIEKLICHLCREPYIFPSLPSELNSVRWAYRVIGPFALTHWADGGYGVAFSIGILLDLLKFNYNISWCLGLDFCSQKVEADFIFFIQSKRKLARHSNNQLTLFGESKSGRAGKINKLRIEKLKKLSELESNSGIVIVLFEFPNENEKILLNEFLEWMNKRERPLILLTGEEIFRPMPFQYRISEIKKELGENCSIDSIARFTQRKNLLFSNSQLLTK